MYVALDEKKAWAEELLRQKYQEIGRLPQKEDFDDVTRSRIKAFLGPWPRALESAGIKEARAKPDKKKRKRNAKTPIGQSSGKAQTKTEQNGKD